MIEKDITIIGGGTGGYVAAIHAAHLGASVALVEKGTLGGTCLNRGCIPTKALVRSAEMLRDARRAGEFGIHVERVAVDFGRVMERKRGVVAQLVSSLEQLMRANRISVYQGHGRLLSPRTVRVNDEEISSRNVIIATGSEDAPLNVPGADLPGVLTTDEVLELGELPQSMAIIGGGYVGAEFAGIFSSFGTKVTIIEMRPLLLENADEEIGRRFTQAIARQGIGVVTGATVKEIRQVDGSLFVAWDTPDGERTVEAKAVLLATGRKPFTGGLGAMEIGVRMNGTGIAVNDYMETNIGGVYATGDVLGTNMLAHVAFHEGILSVENALGSKSRMDYKVVPACIFTYPAIATVGTSEQDARKQGIAYRVSKFPFTASGRAVVMGETDGLVKLVCRAEGGAVLGMHVMGAGADDLIAEGALAIKMGAAAADLASTIHAHPTLPEAVHEAALAQLSGSIHFGRLRNT